MPENTTRGPGYSANHRYMQLPVAWSGAESGNDSVEVVMPYACSLVGLWLYVDNATLVSGTDGALLHVNGSLVTTFTIPTADSTIGPYFATTDAQVYLQAGDRLEVIGISGWSGAIDIHVTFVVQPMSSQAGGVGATSADAHGGGLGGGLDEFVIQGAGTGGTNLDAASANAEGSAVVPSNAEFLGCYFGSSSTVTTGGTLDVVVNGANPVVAGATLLTVPDTIVANKGMWAPVQKEKRVFVTDGDRVSFNTNGDLSGTANVAAVSYVFTRRTANRVRSTREVFLMGGQHDALQSNGNVASTSSSGLEYGAVVPFNAQVLGAYYHIQGSFTVASCATVNTTVEVTVASTSLILAGMTVSGTGVPASTTVAEVTSSTTFDLSAAATGTASVTMTFGGIDAGGNTCDILVNEADSLVDTMLSHTGDDAGSFATPSAQLFVSAGDVLQSRSNGNTTGTIVADIMWVVSP